MATSGSAAAAPRATFDGRGRRPAPGEIQAGFVPSPRAFGQGLDEGSSSIPARVGLTQAGVRNARMFALHELDELLAEIFTFQHADEGLWGVLEPVRDRLAIFDLAGRDPC